MPFVSRSHIGLLVVMLAGLVLALQAITFSPRASAQAETISVGSLSLNVGQQGTVLLEALNMVPLGLGVWTIHVVYNPAVVSVLNCNAMVGGACNPAFNSTTIRNIGATASGLIGDTTLANITLRCDQTGVSALTISIVLLADDTIGNPQPINAAIQNGSVTCGTPPTSTPCAPEGCPTATRTPTPTATATPTPPAGVLPGLDFSIGAGTQCDSTAGPTKCTFHTGQTFTIGFKLNSIPAAFAYAAYDAGITYAGVNLVPGSLVLHGSGSWPSCVFDVTDIGTPGDASFGCVDGIGALPSTYLGIMAHLDFQCPNVATNATLTLRHNEGFVADVVTEDNVSHLEAGPDESLTINCVTASVGGVSLDPHSDALPTNAPSSSGSDAGLLVGVIGDAMVALTAAATLWYWRRRAQP